MMRSSNESRRRIYITQTLNRYPETAFYGQLIKYIQRNNISTSFFQVQIIYFDTHTGKKAGTIQ